MDRYTRRLIVNYVNLSLSVVMMGVGLLWLGWILVTLVQYGIGGIGLSLFTEMTPPPGSSGGLANAIVGSLIMT
ncbi:MAG TPA: phosphate ABC transporter permease PtsA, partial [Gammaproteobacteria bacterium]|nr:phosphate ABC transporter permease PtsA [Gammaproteobacteria bacterium]